jgi:hypothetical protein
MAFALVYTAEHYLVDILLGSVYTLIAFWTVNLVADRLEKRRGDQWSQRDHTPAGGRP